MQHETLKKIMIAGPCALESREQLKECRRLLMPLGINAIRASLWKPRTQPGWEGLGTASLDILFEETIPYGLMPATEIISVEHAHDVVMALKRFGEKGRVLVWLGARNQNHIEQRRVAQVLASGPSSLFFMFKNQMWDDERHWMGISQHILSAGFPMERLLICHRGFSPGKQQNPEGFRNLPDYEMAMRIKEQTKLPMILDPSHIGGTRRNVFKTMEEAKKYDFDGFIIEVHHQPEAAKTDMNQQLSIEEFKKLLGEMRSHQHGNA